jgi:hypothetical protein
MARPLKHDLAGRRFSWLKVTQRAGHKPCRTLWSCVCLCGRSKIASTSDLLSGNVKSCGCRVKALYRAHASEAASMALAVLYSAHQIDIDAEEADWQRIQAGRRRGRPKREAA